MKTRLVMLLVCIGIVVVMVISDAVSAEEKAVIQWTTLLTGNKSYSAPKSYQEAVEFCKANNSGRLLKFGTVHQVWCQVYKEGTPEYAEALKKLHK